MPDLKPITALGGETARRQHHGALALEENTELALASLALRRGGTQPAPFGIDLPGPGAWSQSGEIAAFWTGQDQWMVEGQNRGGNDFASELAALCPGCSVTEQTDGFAVFEIRSSTGERPILQLMAKLVNIDAIRFQPGSATRTGLEHTSVFVIRRAAHHIAILGMRSAAGSIWAALESHIRRIGDREP
ncbi:sarcosine oxidase subunit gamma [Mesorhizobium sp. WSM3868]|uniref:sarcosine oxidase subunit gamma n=1 Tax=Mesorhizobium sp. WSM3868 TaxID=2029405 RepID=UPI000BAFB102|nr:sarcosine oxidase subunit gamma [Mesorhizobium sp. WSM3868]PBB30275.1 sarcosine oxidase subunit gamma [Mesorhizobium sp. WSM3868]